MRADPKVITMAGIIVMAVILVAILVRPLVINQKIAEQQILHLTYQEGYHDGELAMRNAAVTNGYGKWVVITGTNGEPRIEFEWLEKVK